MKEGRKGFTLVELLIVIVVIGILAGMMMISASEVVSSAKASNIISNLTQLKKAILAWYLDNYSRIDWASDGTKNGYKVDGKYEIHEYLSSNSPEVKRYISSNFSLNTGEKNYNTDFYASVGGYSVYMGKGNTILFITYRISDKSDKSDQKTLRQKLKARAKSAKLLSYSTGKDPYEYDGGNFVFMEVFRLEDDKNRRI